MAGRFHQETVPANFILAFWENGPALTGRADYQLRGVAPVGSHNARCNLECFIELAKIFAVQVRKTLRIAWLRRAMKTHIVTHIVEHCCECANQTRLLGIWPEEDQGSEGNIGDKRAQNQAALGKPFR